MIDHIIEKKIQALPQHIRRAVESFDWAGVVMDIGQKYHLQIDDIDIFRREILLIVVGQVDAADFPKNLMKNLGIRGELAQQLLAEANEHIFGPLQKRAFSKESMNEVTTPDQQEFIENLDEHGIQLLDEDFTPRPQNELQDLANEIFFDQTDKTTHTDIDMDAQEDLDHKQRQATAKQEKDIPPQYQEPIDESDLQGISAHRIDTTGFETEKISPSLDKKLFQEMHLSKTETFDFSPTPAEQIKERGEFLKHIGESPDLKA